MSNSYQPKKEIHELEFLYKVGKILSSTTDMARLLDSVLELLASEMSMNRGTVSILHPHTQEIVIDAAYELGVKEKMRGKYKIGEGITGKVVATGRPMAVPKIQNEPEFLDRTRSRSKLDKSHISFICVPINVSDEVIGTLSADHVFNENISLDEDVRLLSIVASMIAQTVKARQASEEEKEELKAENIDLKKKLQERFRPENIMGNSKIMREVYKLIFQVAKSNTTVLIRGESGTGKELIANAIHYESLRRSKPFIKVNCSALPVDLLENELFGHEKGAFTGALNTKKGRFELADGGTIFLDEVGDFSPQTQVKLLRVIQERDFERLGGTQTIKVNVRVIAATHKDIEQAVAERHFREDLYYRLNVFPIHIPPLRERKTDILLLADYFLEKYASLNSKKMLRISTPAIDMLMSYHWPGNVRELENCIERAVLLSEDGVIHGYHLPPTLQTDKATRTELKGTLKSMKDAFEREIVIEALKRNRGNLSQAASELETTKRIFSYMVKKQGIDYRRFRV